jgi:hypothetical protein
MNYSVTRLLRISFSGVIASRCANRRGYRCSNLSLKSQKIRQKRTEIPTAQITPIGAGPLNDERIIFAKV